MARTRAIAFPRERRTAVWWRTNATALLFMGPAVVLVLVFLLAPVVITFVMSLTDLATSTGLSNWQWIGLENYARMFRSQFWLIILGNTLMYVAIVLAFNVVVGLGIALLSVHMEAKAGGVFRSLWLLPRISPSVVYALMWTWAAASPPFGMLNYVVARSEEHTSELQSHHDLVCRLLLEKKKTTALAECLMRTEILSTTRDDSQLRGIPPKSA